MTILGFTTSTDHSSISLLVKGELAKPFSWTRKEQQSEALNAYLKKYLKKNKITFSQIERIAVDVGPGSFTGSRIAVNVAKTLAFDLKLPIFTSSSLDLMAYGAAQKLKPPCTVMCFLDAHRSLYYFREYEIVSPSQISKKDSIQALSLEAIALRGPNFGSLSLIGDMKAEFFGSLTTKIGSCKPQLQINTPTLKSLKFPQATTLVALADSALQTDLHPWTDVEPSYIRSPDAVEKLQLKTLAPEIAPKSLLSLNKSIPIKV